MGEDHSDTHIEYLGEHFVYVAVNLVETVVDLDISVIISRCADRDKLTLVNEISADKSLGLGISGAD